MRAVRAAHFHVKCTKHRFSTVTHYAHELGGARRRQAGAAERVASCLTKEQATRRPGGLDWLRVACALLVRCLLSYAASLKWSSGGKK